MVDLLSIYGIGIQGWGKFTQVGRSLARRKIMWMSLTANKQFPIYWQLARLGWGKDTAVVELHYDFPAQQEPTTNTLGAVPKQLPREEESCATYGRIFRGRERVWRAGSLTSRYVRNSEEDDSIIARVFIFIDVLDQPPPNYRPELLQLLQEIVRASPNTRISLTERPHSITKS